MTTPLLAMGNPVAGVDHGVALWFHSRLTPALVGVLRGITELGSSEWIAIVLSITVLFFIFKRWWPSLVTLVVAVPGGMLLNELVKVMVHRHRPFEDGWFVDWSGYSFASGHTIGATLLYGQLALFLIPVIKGRRRRVLLISSASLVVVLVGFSRVALGAHYLTDVVAGMFFGTIWLMFCLLVARPWRRLDLAPVITEAEPDFVPLPVNSDPAVMQTPGSTV